MDTKPIRISKLRFRIDGFDLIFKDAKILSETDLMLCFIDSKDSRTKSYNKQFLIQEEVLVHDPQ